MKHSFVSYLVAGLLILSLCLIPGLFPNPALGQSVGGSSLFINSTAAEPTGDFVPGEIIVGFKSGLTGAQAQSAAASALPQIKGRIKKNSAEILAQLVDASEEASTARSAKTPASVSTSASTLPQAFLIELDDKSPQAMNEAVAQMKKVSGVSFAEPNYIVRIPQPQASEEAGARPQAGKGNSPDAVVQRNTNDPLLLDQWGYYNIWADFAPELPRSAPAIAVIDTGVDYNHPDLKGRVIKGPDLVNGDKDPMDDNGHGTHVAGIAAANGNNSIGITGISPTSKIYAVKVMSAQGWGTWYDISLGIYAAADRSDVKVLNLSLIGPTSSITLEDAVNYAWGKGKIIVAAAGNDGVTTPNYPAYYTNCIAVAANDSSDERADWGGTSSNYGSWVDIAAPGTDIVSTYTQWHGYAWWSGTSMATPFVAGAAARVWAQNPTWTNTQVRDQLQNTADWKPLHNDHTDKDGPAAWPSPSPFGRLNLYRALGGNPSSVGTLGMEILDGVTGQPVIGATMQALSGKKVVATDTVPADGVTYLTLDPGIYSVKLSKSRYSTLTIPDISVAGGGPTYLGIVPLISGSNTWTVIVTWPDEAVDNDLFGWLPAATPYMLFFDNVGIMSAFPWGRYNRDSSNDGIPLESISLKKTLTGVYNFALYTPNGDDYLRNSGAAAWVYKGTNLVATLPITRSGSGDWWHIGTISKTTFTPINAIGDWPGPYGGGSAGGVDSRGKIKISPQEPAQERPSIPEKPVTPKKTVMAPNR